MENEEKKTKSELYWEKRRLCSDPACIGVIGSDERCKECGKPYEGEIFADSLYSESELESEFESEADDFAEEQADEHEETVSYDEGESVTDEEWANRKLCSDPACIGVVGADGRCKECGKS